MGALRIRHACLVLLACAAVTPSLAQEYSESAVKAAFLYRFTQYVDWPPATLGTHEFTIDVMGAEDVARELERFLPGHPIHGAAASVRRIQSLRELGDAQVLYIGPGRDPAPLIAALPARAILVITDDEGRGLESGGTVNFVVIDRRVRFEISLAAADRAGLRVSSELLGVAQRVQGAPRRSESGCMGPKGLGDPGLRCLPVLARQ